VTQDSHDDWFAQATAAIERRGGTPHYAAMALVSPVCLNDWCGEVFDAIERRLGRPHYRELAGIVPSGQLTEPWDIGDIFGLWDINNPQREHF